MQGIGRFAKVFCQIVKIIFMPFMENYPAIVCNQVIQQAVQKDMMQKNFKRGIPCIYILFPRLKSQINLSDQPIQPSSSPNPASTDARLSTGFHQSLILISQGVDLSHSNCSDINCNAKSKEADFEQLDTIKTDSPIRMLYFIISVNLFTYFS